ncbi:hypothetical protein GGF37_006844 [Kickxella alabastrina]|nr:hypothetical protein GGF37_006844 [Kickxella alabastrina]
MRVNLPMPLRYEATRKDRRRSSSSSSSGSSSSEDEDDDGDQDSLLPDTLLLRKFATVAVGESTINGGSSLFQRLRKSSADHQHHQYNPLSRLPVNWKPRRRSDGSMVLSDFYSQALMASTTSASAPVANPTNCIDQSGNPPTSVAAVPEPIKGVADSEFNDMPSNTQNLILNELMRRESKQGTALIFTTLQAPELGTWEKDNRAMEYLQDIDTLAHDLPPVFLVHATSLTVTTSL